MRIALLLILAACGSTPAPPPEPPIVTTTPTASTCSGLAVAFVIDRSGSMSGAPLDGAKEATIAAARLLGPKDCAEVIAFDSAPVSVHAMNAADLEPHVRALTAGGGTNIQPALELARADLASIRASKKHVLVMTDGQSPRAGLAEVADAIVKDGGTISTIALGDACDEATLGDLATRGHGSFVKSKTPSGLQPLFEKDIRDAK